MHTIFFLQNVFILFIGLCLENKTCQLVILPAWLQILKRKLLSSDANVTIWRPFCLCKLGGQDLRISLGNRVFRIQHTLIRLKSPVPNFYSKMPLEVYRALFFRNSTSLYVGWVGRQCHDSESNLGPQPCVLIVLPLGLLTTTTTLFLISRKR